MERHLSDVLGEKLLAELQAIREFVVDVPTLKEDVAGLKQDVSVLKQDVSVLKQDVSVLKQDVSVLKQDVSVLKQDVSDLKAGQGTIITLLGDQMDRVAKLEAMAHTHN